MVCYYSIVGRRLPEYSEKKGQKKDWAVAMHYSLLSPLSAGNLGTYGGYLEWQHENSVTGLCFGWTHTTYSMEVTVNLNLVFPDCNGLGNRRGKSPCRHCLHPAAREYSKRAQLLARGASIHTYVRHKLSIEQYPKGMMSLHGEPSCLHWVIIRGKNMTCQRDEGNSSKAP